MIGKRVFGLDALRAVAILLVIIGHGLQLLPGFSFIANIADKFFYLGVEIFFVLSGFLIGGILIKTINLESNFSQIIVFWKRRWWRTLPNYYLFLAVNVIGFAILKPNFTFDWSYLIFAQNLIAPNTGFFSVSWSLAVEEWFYILSPLVYFLFLKITKNTIRSFWLACITVMVFSMLVRINYISNGNVTWNEEMRKVVLLRLDSLMYGVLAAWLWQEFRAFLQKNRHLLLLFGGCFIAASIAMKNSQAINTSNLLLFFMFPAASLGAALCLPFFAAWYSGPKESWISKGVTYTSLWSYSLYLIHIPLLEIYKIIFYSGLRDSHLLQIVGFLVWLLLAYGLSFVIYRFFEYPMMQLRDQDWKLVFNGKGLFWGRDRT
jgi:peptidoglycan/LPS O-acetylase OafA/YrhL